MGTTSSSASECQCMSSKGGIAEADNQDPALKQYLIRVIPVVISALEGTIHALLSRYGPDAVSQHVSQARSIIEILQSKAVSA